jgi:hypothetical protein
MVRDIENAVRLLVEVRCLAGAPWRYWQRLIHGHSRYRANRAQIALVHAAVHRELQQLALAFKIRGKCRKGPVSLAVVASPKDAQVCFGRIETTNDVERPLERPVQARLGLGRVRRRETKQYRREKPNQRGRHDLPFHRDPEGCSDP